MFNASSLTCSLLDSSARTCWGLSGPADPAMDTCITCEDQVHTFTAADTQILYPNENTTDNLCGFGQLEWNLTAGEDGTEVWREDNYCAAIALSGEEFKDVEFRGRFSRLDEDDDWIGFVFGYQDPGHFYLVMAPGDWDTHGKYFNLISFDA